VNACTRVSAGSVRRFAKAAHKHMQPASSIHTASLCYRPVRGCRPSCRGKGVFRCCLLTHQLDPEQHLLCCHQDREPALVHKATLQVQHTDDDLADTHPAAAAAAAEV
jgi:hypothetical protein